jgi:hypothetical protein
LLNKAPVVVANQAKSAGKPVYAIVGVNEFEGFAIFEKIVPLADPETLADYTMLHARELVLAKAKGLAESLADLSPIR